MLEVSLLGIRTVLRLERDAWSMDGQMDDVVVGKQQMSTALALASIKVSRFNHDDNNKT